MQSLHGIPRSSVVLFTGIVSSWFLMGCGSGPSSDGGAATGPAPTVAVTEVIQKTVPLYVEYVARTEAVASVEIRARVEGVLQEAHFEEGSRVEKGQLLFTIDPRTYAAAVQDTEASLARARADLRLARQQVELVRAKAELAQARAGFTKAQQDVIRLRPLAAEAAVPEQELDTAVAAELVAKAEVDAAQAGVQNTELSAETYISQAEAAVERAKAALVQAELDLSYTEIRSPIDGWIGRRRVDPGNLVGRSESTLLATVSNYDPINVVFGISETDYLVMFKRANLNKRTAAQEDPYLFELVLADDSKFGHKGRFVSAENTIDPLTGTLTVETRFPNPERLLRPGQFARIRFPVAVRENATLVPRRAIVRLQGVESVYKVSADNKVALHTIATGADFEEFTIVNKGVEPGERIVIEGHQKVRPGMSITPAIRPATTAGEQD